MRCSGSEWKAELESSDQVSFQLVLGLDEREVVCKHNYSVGHCIFKFLVEHKCLR